MAGYISVSLVADVPDLETAKLAIQWIKNKLAERDDLTITGKYIENVEDE